MNKLTKSDIDHVKRLYHNHVKENGDLELFSLDKITDEHAIEVGRIIRKMQLIGKPVLRDILHNLKYGGDFTDRLSLKTAMAVIQYLISKGYAVPLWFGIDHPCNGLTAIQLNIAIDNTIEP